MTSYDKTKSFNNNTIPRAAPHFRTADQKRKRTKNKGSIRADFEEGDTTSEEGAGPGPGNYLKGYHVTTFGQQPILHDHPQQFGHCEQRFVDPNAKMGTKVGPGQYLSQNLKEKFAVKVGKEGTNHFKAPGRKPLYTINETPGPSSNMPHSEHTSAKNSGNHHPFAFNEKRFSEADTDVPGAGTYKLKDSVQVKNKGKPHANFKSGVEKSWDIVIGKDNPGVGAYDNHQQKTIANKEF